MNIDDPIKLVSQLIDLPIIDSDERWCGMVDDVEFSGGAGKEARIKALLVGPGAYSGRMPRWMFWLVRKVVGAGLTRVPVGKVIEVGSVVKLGCKAEELSLRRSENKVREWIPRWGAM